MLSIEGIEGKGRESRRTRIKVVRGKETVCCWVAGQGTLIRIADSGWFNVPYSSGSNCTTRKELWLPTNSAGSKFCCLCMHPGMHSCAMDLNIARPASRGAGGGGECRALWRETSGLMFIVSCGPLERAGLARPIYRGVMFWSMNTYLVFVSFSFSFSSSFLFLMRFSGFIYWRYFIYHFVSRPVTCIELLLVLVTTDQ